MHSPTGFIPAFANDLTVRPSPIRVEMLSFSNRNSIFASRLTLNTMKKELQTYCPPAWEELPLQLGGMLCESQEDGSIEDITIEDWNLN